MQRRWDTFKFRSDKHNVMDKRTIEFNKIVSGR